jgi:hypothetical protein
MLFSSIADGSHECNSEVSLFHRTEDAAEPVTVTARSKAWTVFSRSDSGFVGSNPSQVMDVSYVYAFILCVVPCLVTGLATA